MFTNDRLNQIIGLVNTRGFLSVTELSQLCSVSEMTIRRDLARLQSENQLARVYGGAVSIHKNTQPASFPEEIQLAERYEGRLVERVDVLIATSVNPKFDGALINLITRRNIPFIAESQALQKAETLVAVDNFQAGLELGRWAGHFALEQLGGEAHVLDLTTRHSNCTARSRGFFSGLHEILPTAETLLSADCQSRYDIAYQLTRDALAVHSNLNVIFAINDTLALGAINACIDRNISPERLIVIPFGLEGHTLKNALVQPNSYVRAGLAMFPEIVGPTCIEAAIRAFNHQPLPNPLITPYVILTAETLPDFYTRVTHLTDEDQPAQWEIRWDATLSSLFLPINLGHTIHPEMDNLPRRVGFVVPYGEHEWYKNLILAMRAHAEKFGIQFEIVDLAQDLKDEIELRRRHIAQLALEQIRPGEVILIDGGPIANYRAELLVEKEGLTIITNSMAVFDILRQNSEHVLICTGGAYRSSSQLLVGPPAEGALRELRADKLFLMVTGITLNFGLSHTNISEVTIKQAMIRSAREVILLADSTCFGQDSVIQVAPVTVVHRLISDDALPASTRLEISKLGIQLSLAQ